MTGKYLQKNVFLKTIILSGAVIFLVSGCSKDRLAEDFISPPESMTTGVYWYWMSDNISKEGVVKDLHAMKQAGINSVFIGNIGGEGAPYGNVKLFTDEWWDILHAAMKTAGELDIEVGMFNSPGWSHSGGPWIKAGQSMRHLVASETWVTGGGKVTVQLPVPQQPTQYKDWSSKFINHEGKPSPHFQDVRTLAVPVSEDYRLNLFDEAGAKVTTANMRPLKGVSLEYTVIDVPDDSPLSIKYVVPKGEEASITLRLLQPEDARSLSIYPASRCRGEGELQAKVDGDFVTVAVFPLYRIFPIPSVGYTPFAPVVTGFDKLSSDEYRIVFRNTAFDAAIGKIILSPTAVIDQYPEKTLARMYQSGNPPYTEYKWTSAQSVPADDDATAIVPEKVIDVTDKMQPDGTLVWDAPKGNWLVMRMGMVPNEVFISPTSPEGSGWEVDKLNTEYLQHHFDNFLGEVLRRIPAEDRRTFHVTVMDSWEKGAQTFTDNFIDSLKARYGYDPTPFLPTLTGHLVGSPEQSERFLWDVRRLAAEITGNHFLPNFKTILHKHGIETWIENYGDWGFPGEFLLYGKNSDRVGGEFWPGGGDNMRYMDVAASCAHIYNKPRVYAESFTSGAGYSAYPYLLKRDADAAFAAGLTSCILHVYIEQPSDDINPGICAWFGTEFNRQNTWFRQVDLFTAYLKRCGVMLEQGLSVSDVAYFIGEDVPVNSGPFGLNPNMAKNGIDVPVLPQGYHADYVNSDVITNNMSVKDGRIVLPHGVSYSILVLPPFETMRPEVLKSIERLVNDGAVVLGEAPKRSPSFQNYPEADKELIMLANKMWASTLSTEEKSYGKGKILSGMTIEEALTTLNIAPDVKLNNKDMVYNHRTTADREIYFIANRSNKPVQITPEFRAAGQPELWNPVTGERRILPAFECKDVSTIVPLQFEPCESMFIVFAGKGNPKSSNVNDNFPTPEVITEINTPWTASFESDKIRRGPSEPVVFDKLQSWHENEDSRIRYYSGTAVYSNVFTLDDKPAGNIYVDLGKVGVMAKVKINGQYVGGAWTYPYRMNIADAVKPGKNTIEVEVVSTWMNRIIGDALLPENERKLIYNVESWKSEKMNESGLLEPVKIISN
ncbi:MAG: glycoside hydrolase family 2 [Prevotellaceae bacterium]|nr:glycoside hydrolase family 2 [Prevotellaceae bacterium]